MSMAGQSAGLKPSQFVEGGGLVSDIDVVFQEVAFVMWDYDGKIPQANPAIKVKMVEEEGTEHEQYWSSGNSKDWVASEDGKKLVAVGSSSGINSGSNAGILLTSIVNAGFPEDKIGDDIKIFQGMRCHVIRQAAPKRNIVRAPRADGRTYEDTVLVVSKIHQLPWEKKGAAPGKTITTATSAAASDGDLSEKATGVVMEILASEGKAIPKQQLVTKVFQHVKTDPDRNKLVQLVHKDEFLSNGPWSYDKGMVSAG
jgi:hypothetical protein